MWGSGTFNGKGTGAIYTWERNAWRAHGLNLGANSASSDVSQRTARGAVVYLWNTRWWEESKNEAIVTQHSGTTSRVVARGKMSPSTQTIFQSARGTTWLTTGQKIYRVVGQKIQIEYSIAKAQFRRAAASAETQDETNPLQMSEDVRGRIYFWSNTLLGGTNYRSLRGILIFDGKKWTHLPRITGAIAGAADKPLTVFQAKDARHFWMAVGEEALYQFDIETRRAQKIAEPQKGAFKWVHKIERSGSDWFVFCERPETAYPDGDSSLRSNDLWRLRRGKWQKIVTGLDGGGEFSEFSNRAFLPDKNGLWIGSLWGGIWFVPQTPSGKTASGKVGVARRFDWRDGFDLLATNRLFRLRDGRIAAFNLGGYGARIGADVRPFLRTRPTSAYATSAYATFTRIAQNAPLLAAGMDEGTFDRLDAG